MRNSSMRRLLLTAAGGMMLSGLAACSRSQPEGVELRNIEASAEIVEDPAPSSIPTEDARTTPAETSIEANAVDETPPETVASPDEQMLDDASATGMTARATRGEEEPVEAPVAGNSETD